METPPIGTEFDSQDLAQLAGSIVDALPEKSGFVGLVMQECEAGRIDTEKARRLLSNTILDHQQQGEQFGGKSEK